MFRFFKQKSQSTPDSDSVRESVEDAHDVEAEQDSLAADNTSASTNDSLGDDVHTRHDETEPDAVTEIAPAQPSQQSQNKQDTSKELKKEDEAVKSGQLSARLSDAGYVLPSVATPVAAYVPAVVLAGGDRKNRLVQTSGQLPMVEGKLVATGKTGQGDGLLDVKYVYQLAKVCALNALAAAADVAGGIDRIDGVEKVTAFVASDPEFYDQALVANGASEFFGELFDDGHARSAVGVAVLPLNAPVEVEVVFRVK